MTKYTIDDLMVVRGAVKWVRSKPEIFFPCGHPDAVVICQLLVRDALVLGANEVSVLHEQPWWIVGSQLDWLAPSGLSPAELFGRLVAFPAAGQNESRSEVVVAAFAEKVATVARDDASQTFGDDDALVVARETLRKVEGWNRCIVFVLHAQESDHDHQAGSASPAPSAG